MSQYYQVLNKSRGWEVSWPALHFSLLLVLYDRKVEEIVVERRNPIRSQYFPFESAVD